MKNLCAGMLIGALAIGLQPIAPTKAALVYGGGQETGTRFNPGAGAITYMNTFTAVTPEQNVLEITSAAFGVRRVATSGALIDVGLNLYAAEMTFDGSDFGRGANNLIFSTPSLGAGAASATQIVNTGALSGIDLALETTSNAGLGGWWMGLEFTGPNAGNAANGWRVVTNAPLTGASINAFGIFNNGGSGIFEAFFAFGTPPGSSPSRLMVDVIGVLKSEASAAPAPLPLLGVGATVACARRLRARARMDRPSTGKR
jgi:hypothetical protein